MKRSLSFNTLLVMAGTFSSRILGIVRQQVYVGLFSPALRDAFDAATRVPNLFREILAEGAVQNALIPMLSTLEPEAKKAFGRQFTGFLLAVNALVVGLLWVSAPWIAQVLIDPSSYLRQPEHMAQVVMLIRLVSPFLLMISMASLFSAFAQSNERFGNSFAPVAFNVGSIALMAFGANNPTFLGLSYTLGGFLQALVQINALRTFGLGFGVGGSKATPSVGPNVMLAVRRMGPFLFTTGLRQILNVVLVRILTQFPAGVTNAFYNAETIYLMALGLLATSPAMAIFPRLAALKDDITALKSTLQGYLPKFVVLIALATALLAALAPWTSSIYALTSNFTPENRHYCTLALSALGLSLLPWGINTLLLRVFYALGQVAVAVRFSVMVLVVNILGYLALEGYGMYALNVATVCAGWFGLVLYVQHLQRQQVLDAKPLVVLLVKSVFVAGVAGVNGYMVANMWGMPDRFWANVAPLLAGGATTLAMFVLGAKLLRLPLGLRAKKA